MGIGLIFIVWILVGAVFLAKLSPLRELAARLRSEPAPDGGFAVLSAGVDGDGYDPGTDINHVRLGIEPDDRVWHRVGDHIGSFNVVSDTGTKPVNVEWSADYAEVSEDTGDGAAVAVYPEPPASGGDSITLTAVSVLDGGTYITNSISIPKCSWLSFALVSATRNFPPHLGGSASFHLDLPGCRHFPPEGWLEGEVTRRAVGGWQHVGWIDMEPDEAGHQKRIGSPPLQHTVVWDGIATEGAAAAESAYVFTAGREPFRQILPTVISGEPVPPPYYTVVFRHRGGDSDNATILNEASTTVYVPQVVKIEMTEAAYSEFCRPVVFPESDWPNEINTQEEPLYAGDPLFYTGCTNMTIEQVKQTIAAKSQGFVPGDVNLRFTSLPVKGRTKHVNVVLVAELKKEVPDSFGFTDGKHVSWRNSNPHGVAYVYMDKLRKDPCDEKILAVGGTYYENSYDPDLFPFNDFDLLNAVAFVSTHETGHALGLVNNLLWGLDMHNLPRESGNGEMIMDDGDAQTHMQRFGKPSVPSTWKTRNLYYLKFILPKTLKNL